MIQKVTLLYCFLLLTQMFAFSQTFKAGKSQLIPFSDTHKPLAEPHLAVNPDNPAHMLAAAMCYDSAVTSEIRTHIVLFATKDNGLTWSQTDLDMISGFDPWVAIRNDKQAVLVALAGYKDAPRMNLVAYHSEDGGFTWNRQPVKFGAAHDHPTLAMDMENDRRLYVLSSLVMRKDSVKNFVAYMNYSDDWKTFQDSGFHFVTGTMSSNTLTALVSDGKFIAPYIEYSVTNNQATGASVKMTSYDCCLGFTEAKLVTSNIGVRKGFAALAVDNYSKYKGRMYLLKNSGEDALRSNGLFLQYSTDGISWSKDIRVDQNNNKEKFIRNGTISVSKDEVIGVAFVDRRNDTALTKNDVYFTISQDGGFSFQNEIRLTDINSDPLTTLNGKAGTRHLAGGDYMGCVAKPDGSFQVLWADARSGIYQLYTTEIKIKEY